MRFVAMLAALLALLGATEGRAQERSWRHGILEAKGDSGVMFMVGQGFAERQGLKLELVQFKNDVVPLQALLAGELDSFEGGIQGVIVAGSRGADVRILGCHWPGLPHGIYVRAGITTPQDLRGKTIAISAPGAFPFILANALLAKYDIPESAVKFANLGSDIDRYKAVVAGVVDAGISSSEYVPLAEQAGIKLLLRGRDILPDYVRTCIMTSGKTLATRRDDTIRFIAAEMNAVAYAVAHRDATLTLAAQLTSTKPDDPRAAYLFDDALRTNGIDPSLGLPVEKFAWLEQLLIKQGDVQHQFDIAKLVDGDIRVKALALAGQ